MGKTKSETEPNVLKSFAHSLGTEIKPNGKAEIEKINLAASGLQTKTIYDHN